MANDVHVGRGDFGVDSGDLGVMSGYVSDDTEDGHASDALHGLTIVTVIDDVRMNCALWWLRPDCKTSVSCEKLKFHR